MSQLDELQEASKNLLELSNSLVDRQFNQSESLLEILIGYAMTGCIALPIAALPAWISTGWVSEQSALIIFCAMIIFFGCLIISYAIRGQAMANQKTIDNINALRVILIYLSNKIGYLAGNRNEF